VRSVLQNLNWLSGILRESCAKPPRKLLEAFTLCALAEVLLAPPARRGPSVHAAVEWSKSALSKGEAGFLNAVLRKVAARADALIAEPAPAGDAAWVSWISRRHSHPEWWVRRMLAARGREWTERCVLSNQERPSAWLRLSGSDLTDEELTSTGLTERQGSFVRVPSGADWSRIEGWLSSGRVYAQAPATGAAVDLLAPAIGERILDVCAAPGGKTLALAAAVGALGRVVAVDLPGERLERLRQNLAARPAVAVGVIGADATTGLAAVLLAAGEPEFYDGVLVDAPCSNTGVWRHKPDARWRLREHELSGLAAFQIRLINGASQSVAVGGRLVYATCSVEPCENEEVVRAWLSGPGGRGFVLESETFVAPWEGGGDGAYAARLRRVT
jgi:16S rRNA (cytosine967-C5)-methyltransferase